MVNSWSNIDFVYLLGRHRKLNLFGGIVNAGRAQDVDRELPGIVTLKDVVIINVVGVTQMPIPDLDGIAAIWLYQDPKLDGFSFRNLRFHHTGERYG